MKLTDEQIAAIRDGTDGVTPYVVFTDGDIHLRERDMNGIMPKIGHVKASKLVSHIARCDPDTVRALAIEVLESRADIARLTKERDDVGVRQFNLGERVTKIKGSSWTGRVVGFYSTTLTPEGYAVESETERGSVQIYPAAALRAMKGDAT